MKKLPMDSIESSKPGDDGTLFGSSLLIVDARDNFTNRFSGINSEAPCFQPFQRMS